MKKVCLLLFLLLSINGFSQIDYGLRIGLDYNFKNSITADNFQIKDVYDGSSGITAGLFLRAKLPFLGFFVQPEILYNYQKSNFKLNSDINFSNHNINVPILFGQNIVFFNWYLGPVVSFNIKSNSSSGSHWLSDSYKKPNLSGMVGVGVEIWKFMVDLRYQFGFSKLNYKIENIDMSSRNNTINLSLAYKF